MTRVTTPTEQAYGELQLAYDFFNAALFGGTLPPCLITLQRRARTMGYFSPERFTQANGATTDEIAMNPEFFLRDQIEDTLSTLVHEMVHLWQEHHGKPGRRRYHNKQWAAKMREIGLQPSDTGAPGGKQTGEQMTHYVLEDGRFREVCRQLISTQFRLSWSDRQQRMRQSGEDEGEGERPPNASNRVKFTCPGCGANAWGKPHLGLVCKACALDFEPEHADAHPRVANLATPARLAA